MVVFVFLINLITLLAILWFGVDCILQGDVLPEVIFFMIGLGIIALLLKGVKDMI